MKQCLFCRTALKLEDNFCAKCGDSLGEIEIRNEEIGGIKPSGCIKCGRPYDINDVFCVHCGWFVKDREYVDDGLVFAVNIHDRTLYIRPDLPRKMTDPAEYWEYFLLLLRHYDIQTVLTPCLDVIHSTLNDIPLPEETANMFIIILADNLYKACAHVGYYSESLSTFFREIFHAYHQNLSKYSKKKLISIIDNTIDPQRVSVMQKILETSGYAVILPNKEGRLLDREQVLEELRTHINNREHIFYIEPDGEVDCLNAVENVARNTKGYITSFRNQAPLFHSNPKQLLPSGE